jgi:hypothetical protein
VRQRNGLDEQDAFVVAEFEELFCDVLMTVKGIGGDIFATLVTHESPSTSM